MRAVIISGGVINNYDSIKELIRETDTIICADSGYDHAVKMGICTDMLMGDFDSISHIPDGVRSISYPSAKAFTDTELAADWARGQGFREFLFLGSTGGRMDHTLANIFLAAGMSAQGISCEVADEYCRMIPVKDASLTITEPAGTTVSLIPLDECSGVSTVNMEYPLDNASLVTETTRGISNVVIKSPAGISVSRGTLLCIIVR